ncbi:MAG: hypothetical protein HUJ25_00850 [Crocinitomicaceae bacterium]|nr:hypothetical protein [Crocinitomicaceae bacterium]
MEDFLNWYFSWRYSIVLAVGLLMVWMFSMMVVSKKLGGFKQLQKKWWYWTGTLLLVINIPLLNWINPEYWGYGNPLYFSYIQVTDDHVLLYDQQYSYHEERNSSDNHATEVPNLRAHVVDPVQRKKLYTDHIGDYYFPRQIGRQAIIIENNTYSDYTARDEIQSVVRYNVDKKKTELLAEDGLIIQIDGEEAEVFDIYEDKDRIRIKTSVGKVAELSENEPVFHWLTQEMREEAGVKYYLYSNQLHPDNKDLAIDGEATDLSFLQGNLVNQHNYNGKSFAMIYSLNSLKKTNPKLSLVNHSGQLLWEVNLEQLKKLSGRSDLKYIHRSILAFDKCYITSANVLFEFDLMTGKLNWFLAL